MILPGLLQIKHFVSARAFRGGARGPEGLRAPPPPRLTVSADIRDDGEELS
jgi:hypothetical protein